MVEELLNRSRLRIGHIKAEHLSQLFAVPKDVKIIRFEASPGPRKAAIVMQHDSFPLVAQGGKIPVVESTAPIKPEPDDPYGVCPHCGAKCVRREKQIGGNDTCENGHVYPSAAAIKG